ncbi:MAG: hypothetical protein CSYNP_03547 [Syntrophus sp. SKADARSKE-3]|nr:hypothetical protein [Syntrophus sp. SKADARSKE-3]
MIGIIATACGISMDVKTFADHCVLVIYSNQGSLYIIHLDWKETLKRVGYFSVLIVRY